MSMAETDANSRMATRREEDYEDAEEEDAEEELEIFEEAWCWQKQFGGQVPSRLLDSPCAKETAAPVARIIWKQGHRG